MIYSDRVRSQMAKVGLNQSQLARRINVTQGAIAKIANNNPAGSSHLHRIARVLQTTSEYLTGETDEPSPTAALPIPSEQLHFVQLAVALPSERALTRMFDALLELIDALPAEVDRSERARLLARWLPTGLSQLRDLLPDQAAALPEPAKELAAALAIHDPAQR